MAQMSCAEETPFRKSGAEMTRDGVTTGSCATAAAMAAARYVFSGSSSTNVNIPLPPFDKFGASGRRDVAITRVGALENGLAFAEVAKDGGDDPDVTHGMIIRVELHSADVTLTSRGAPYLEIEGGEGIGRVTLPGLPVAVGRAAINPIPEAQTRAGLMEIFAEANVKPTLRVVISAPEGAERARGTLNAKLGIIGGISILGTRGIVKPYSAEAYKASIAESLNVAKAIGCQRVCLSPGRGGIDAMRGIFPDLPDAAFVVAGDFVAHALSLASSFRYVHWGCFIGKLVKLAQGLRNTHARSAELEMAFLARAVGMPELASLMTARAGLKQMLANGGDSVNKLLKLAKAQAGLFAGRRIIIHLFGADGEELGRL